MRGFSTADWQRLGEIFRPQPDVSRDRHEVADSAGGIIAVTTGQRLRKLVTTKRGRIDPRTQPWPVPLEQLAARHGARWAAQIHTGALEELMERFGERLRPEQDYLAQLLLLLGILRELELEGALQTWPRTVSAWPVPSERLVARALDAFCPEGRGVLLGVFEAGEVATSLAARRSGGGFDLVLGPDELRGQMGLLSGDWTRDYRHLARAAELSVGPLALGCFGEMATFQRLASRSTAPGAWAAAVASRDLILAPVAPALAVPLGLDVGRAAVAAARDLVQRVSASPWLAPDGPLASAFDRLGQIQVLDQDIKSLLGFDPLALLRRLLSRDPEEH